MKAAPSPLGYPARGLAWEAMAGWAAHACLFFLFCFRPGVLRSDDFGYIRSIIGTWQRGRPYTYDWLAPFGAVFSSACALLYKLTGNFYLATYGFQAFCVLAFFPLLYLLIAKRLPPRPAALLALSAVAFPLLLAKESDFHGCIGTLDLVLVSLLFFESGRYEGFYLAALLAFANRQNQICLLALPIWAAWEQWRGGGKVTLRIPMGGALFLAGCATVSLGMNRTYAGTNAVFRTSGPGTFAAAAAVAACAGIFVAMGAWGVFSTLRIRSGISRSGGDQGRRQWLFPACASVALLVLIPFWPPNLIQTDTPMFGLLGWPQVNRILPWLILPSFWIPDYRLLRPSPYLFLAAGYIAVASLRGIWWDYYFAEILILCLLSALDRTGASKDAVVSERSLAPAAYWVASVLLAGSVAYGYMLKVAMDKQALAVTVMERLDREGRITVDKMTGATFGYLGWKLFDYFLTHEGRNYGELADFVGYVRRDRVVVDTYTPWRRSFKAGLPTGSELLDRGTYRIGFFSLPYRVADLHGPSAGIPIMGRDMTLDPAQFRSPRFPLDNQEWKAYLDSLPRL